MSLSPSSASVGINHKPRYFVLKWLLAPKLVILGRSGCHRCPCEGTGLLEGVMCPLEGRRSGSCHSWGLKGSSVTQKALLPHMPEAASDRVSGNTERPRHQEFWAAALNHEILGCLSPKAGAGCRPNVPCIPSTPP